MTDLLLPQAQASRAGAQGDDDYDVMGADGIVVGRIFKATTSPVRTRWMWTLAYGDHEDRTPTHGYEATRHAAMQAFARSLVQGDVVAFGRRLSSGRLRGFTRLAVSSASGQVLIIGSDLKHLLFGDRIGHVLRQSARFLRMVVPVLWII